MNNAVDDIPLMFIPTDRAPAVPGTRVASFKPKLLQTPDQHLCPGCGEPIAVRLVLEIIEELGLEARNVAVIGHGCYGGFVTTLDVDCTLCLHGRGPAVATGIKRMRPDCAVWTLQGDGDMVSEGLAEILHATARGENITCVLLNNGVFGDTGGQMTSMSVLGQRTKTSLEGRNVEQHGHPIPIASLVAALDGSGYVARGSVHDTAAIAQTKRLVRRAFQRPMQGHGLALIEILTMCPTGWFVPTAEGPQYMRDTLGKAYPFGELKDVAPDTVPA